MSATLLKKLSVKGICGSLKAPEVGEVVPVAVIIGYASSYKMKTTTFGDSFGFSGNFKGTNVETGETFNSGVCYLPDVATTMLKSAIDANDGKTVEFGFTISLVGVKGREDDEANKYEYRCAPLMEAAANDPLALLEANLKAGNVAQPRIAAPKPAATKSTPAKGKGKGKGR